MTILNGTAKQHWRKPTKLSVYKKHGK